jgi:3-dehydroquinate dehydratase/shikimate dehydrogenase
MIEVSLVAVASAPFSHDFKEIDELPATVKWLQVRADLIGDVSASRLREHFSGKILYTLRSGRSGGMFAGPDLERQKRILAASEAYDLVELESDSDLSPSLLTSIPARKRMLFWKAANCELTSLLSTFDSLAAVPACFYCISIPALKTSDGLCSLRLLKALARKDVAVISEGPFGLWSRLVAPHFGSPLLFGSLANHGGREDELTINQLIEDYGFSQVTPVQQLYGMVGNRIFQSLSPRLHNTGYQLLRHPALFVPFHTNSFEDFWQEMIQSSAMDSLGIPVQGLTIASPYKEVALAMAGTHSAMVRRAAASNVFVRRVGIWEAHTTDPDSVTCLNGKLANHPQGIKAAVIGCGGAGRAVAASLQQAGVHVTLVNRGKERGDYAVKLLGLPFVSLAEFQPDDFTLLVNATPIGRDDEALPFLLDRVNKSAVVVDLTYGKKRTALVSGMLGRGGTVVDGYQVLLTQVRKQFQMMVGLEMPPNVSPGVAMSDRPVRFLSSHAQWMAEQEAHECNP